MQHPKRATDTKDSYTHNRTDRIINDGLDYYYRTRNGGVSTAFDTRAAALYDLNNFVLATSLEAEFKDAKTETFS